MHPNLNRLLKDVSRSFYLTMRVLPSAVRPQIAIAYLLARATDTIADSDAVPVNERIEALRRLRQRIAGNSEESLDLKRFLVARPEQAAEAEQTLLARVEEAVNMLPTFSPMDQERIRAVLSTITSGQELDLIRFGGLRHGAITALQNDAELDDYTYRVAGCVGEFWTRICRAHLFPDHPIDEAWLLTNSIRFGKGLQLVNILRDLPADLRIGRCYLPSDRLARHGLSASDLLEAANEPRFRKLYGEYLALAGGHLQAGWDYTNALPFRQVRVRLACAWPLLIGAATLKKLQSNCILEAGPPIKITRQEVRTVLVRSVIWYCWPQKWIRLFPSVRC